MGAATVPAFSVGSGVVRSLASENKIHPGMLKASRASIYPSTSFNCQGFYRCKMLQTAIVCGRPDCNEPMRREDNAGGVVETRKKTECFHTLP
jgi:hypothetical protein